MLQKYVRSVAIQCRTNNIICSSSDEMSLGVTGIAIPTFHCYPNIKVVVSGILPRAIDWSMWRVKIKKTNGYLRGYCKKSTKTNSMSQHPACTLPDNSLNMQLYYKDHLHLIVNGNIKFCNLITRILQHILLPQLSSRLLKWSLINLLPPLFQSPPSQSLLVTARPFSPKFQRFLLNFPTAPPNLQNFPASPPFLQVFSSPLKTNSDHMSSTKPTKLITLPTSILLHLKLCSHLR